MAQGYSGVGGGLNAIQDAIGMYFGLREKKFDRQRQERQDSRADRALALQEENAKLDAEQFHEGQLGNRRRLLANMAVDFEGKPIGDDTANAYREAGMGEYVGPETINLAPPKLTPAIGQEPPLGPMTPTPTGRSVLREQSPSEAYRRAIEVARLRAGEQQTAELGRNNRNAANIAARAATAHNNDRFREAALALQRQGMAITSDRLALAYAQANADLDESTFRMKLARETASPNFTQLVLGMLGQPGAAGTASPFGQMPAMPQVPPQPDYFTPPSATRPGSRRYIPEP